MRARYVVRPIDNGQSVEGLVRERTWGVFRITRRGEEGVLTDELFTRAEAYAVKREHEAEGEEVNQ